MPLGTLDRAPQPFFKQGQSAQSKLMFLSALALFLMVADARLNIASPLRSTVATLLHPLAWLARQPIELSRNATDYFDYLATAKSSQDAAQRQLAAQSLRAGQVEQLTLENARLRQLLGLRDQLALQGLAAEVLYDAADPFARKVVVDRGLAHNVAPGSPVIDASGVLGQVTRVHPLVSEVTLVTDRDHAIPVLNTRTGARNVLYGEPGTDGGMLDLRFMISSADVMQGDLLTTSGVDGVYPAGLPVATVANIERRGESSFARILCTPAAQVGGSRHVIILPPVASQIPARPTETTSPASSAGKTGNGNATGKEKKP